MVRLEPIWATRDYPVLLAVAARLEQTVGRLYAPDLADELSRDLGTLLVALRGLRSR